jgi:acetyl esterase/lipase
LRIFVPFVVKIKLRFPVKHNALINWTTFLSRHTLIPMKRDYSAIHPELRLFARFTPKVTYNRHNVWLFHRILGAARVSIPPRDLRIHNAWVPRRGDQTSLRLRIYQPDALAAPSGTMLWLHGGGYVMGTPEQDDKRCAEFVRELGMVVVSVDYRLAPEDPFPAALEDSYTALTWMASQAQQLGIDSARIAVAGASAGGGLAAALAQLAHDRKDIQPAFQLLIFPMLDDRTVLRGDGVNCANVIWNQKSNRFGWESYLGKACGNEKVPEYGAPARREDLSGLPPAWIGVGTLDLFHDESLAYAQRLQEAGVACEFYPVQGAFHGFDIFNAGLPVVRGFRESQISALSQLSSSSTAVSRLSPHTSK